VAAKELPPAGRERLARVSLVETQLEIVVQVGVELPRWGPVTQSSQRVVTVVTVLLPLSQVLLLLAPEVVAGLLTRLPALGARVEEGPAQFLGLVQLLVMRTQAEGEVDAEVRPVGQFLVPAVPVLLFSSTPSGQFQLSVRD